MREMRLDVESKSEADLTKVGAHAYFEHKTTDLYCAAYSFEDAEPKIWWPGEPCPQEIIDHVEAGGVITAWNAAFERLAWRHLLHAKYGWPEAADEQFRCTMTESLAMNMPAKLDKAGPAFGLDICKDEKGHRLMMQMCRPRKPRKGENTEPDANGLLWWDDADRLERLGEYCKQDVRVEAAIARRVLRLRPTEQKLYYLDMKINDRGVYIDKDLCNAASRIVKSSTARLDAELFRVTGEYVSACSNTAQLCAWLNKKGVPTESVDKEHVEDLLILDIPDDCRRALEIRQEGAKTSTAKIGSMLRRRQADGRMRGNLQLYGAGATGRWAARGAQLQNLPRPAILGSKKSKPTPLDDQIKNAIDCIYYGSPVLLEMVYGRPLTLVADCVRSMIVAPKGKILMSSDFSNIEGRAVAWLAGQEDKLDAFRAYDDGTGPDLYLVAAAGIYNTTIEGAEPHRQIGKVGELSLGFQGGPRAFAKMSKNYGVRIGRLFGPIWEMAEGVFKDRAMEGWKDRGSKSGMAREAWLAAEVIKLAWRAKNYRIEAYWHDIEQAAITAVKNKGEIVTCGYVKFRQVGSFLFCLLPSGRGLCYPYPKLKSKMTPWGESRTQLTYKSTNQFTKKWEEKAYYGGLGVENITQAVARDVMAEAMLRVEDAGYNTVLTVHDEILSENDADYGSLDEYNALMTELPTWATGFPITAAGWCGDRYRKG